MIKRAEIFKKYVEEKSPGVFQIEEVEGSSQQTVVFRSYVGIEGQQLPVMVVIDSSVFTLMRVQISPSAKSEKNIERLMEYINEENKAYKPFKFFINDDGDMMMDTFLVNVKEEEYESEQVFMMFDIIIGYLKDNYREIMSKIWGANE